MNAVVAASELGPLEARIVDFSCGLKFDDLPHAAVRAAKWRVIDSIGVAMAAYLSPPARIARRLAQETTGPLGARVWGPLTRTTPDMAAFANGVMVRYLDLNDAWRTKDAHHPSDYLPGIMAVAEAVKSPGQRFIAALAVAYELMCRFTDSVPFNAAGWDQPLTGALGTAMAVGHLLGLDRERMGHALALALIPNMCTYQTRAGELSMWKGCAGPNGARNGIFAALLAAEGMSGPFQAFDGEFGVWNQTLKGEAFPVVLPDGSADWKWALMQTNIKTFPVRDSCQLPIATAIELREKILPAEIEHLEIETYRSAWEGAVKDKELWTPRTRETADHSMLFCVACALIDGAVTPESFERERFLDRDILDMIGRTEVEVLDEFNRATPAVRNCRIVARHRNGNVTIAHRAISLAEIERGLAEEDLERKFAQCVAKTFSARQRDAVIKAALALDDADDVLGLVDLLRV
jgi:2-methylcitrate dehydratase